MRRGDPKLPNAGGAGLESMYEKMNHAYREKEIGRLHSTKPPTGGKH
jgi:hypothetical protein